MLKKFPEEDFIKEMVADLHDNEDGLLEPESHHDHSPAHSLGNVYSPTNEVQQETSTQDRTSLPSEQTVAKEAHIQSSIHEGNGNATTNFSQDTILTNMRARRVKAPNLCRSESSRYPVYLLSLRNKGRIVANAKLVTIDAKRDIGGSVLGKEYVGVYVEGLESVDSRNKGDELIPRPVSDIRTLIDAIGYVIAWPHSHVKKATSTNLKQLGDITFQGRSEAAMERGKNGQ
ncbi:uncharacterized protein LOC101779644 isoform X1 [Setaria italica]|uniref:uncharacterized protein LOC101779644 isoform X1 n=1 Tax=Setaria italica TaxID=4555 RepID=UPI00064697F2|nr:uncharacterized protein LOC101779644 isoform X1 [Setaria italica]XP_012698715.1 uncharacterized protein LOC101779644 isoform X1 [Setaria italica]XP_012698716.1 uncharacterized protein LOC101779644 isoform X1 [Setaria italica]XP_012698717.1 uncharacterized protein LOC101779644 isoform X1 [Setaria italica]